MHLRAHDRDRARADLDALDKALAPQAQMRLAMSELYLHLEQPAQSLEQLNHWLPAHPDEVRRHAALSSRCWARAMLGIELDKALSDCNAALGAEAKNAAYLASRGWVHLRLGRYAMAVADFDRALELRPGLAWTLFGRGLAKIRLGAEALGEADLDAARKAQPDIDLAVARAGMAADQAVKR
jgi:tetratricopeptide (TPR) repeat protein